MGKLQEIINHSQVIILLKSTSNLHQLRRLDKTRPTHLAAPSKHTRLPVKLCGVSVYPYAHHSRFYNNVLNIHISTI